MSKFTPFEITGENYSSPNPLEVSADLNIGIKVLTPYETAVKHGYTGSFEQWIHDTAPYFCDIADFYVDDNGHLHGIYDIDKYNFSIDEQGHLIVTEKVGE